MLDCIEYFAYLLSLTIYIYSFVTIDPSNPASFRFGRKTGENPRPSAKCSRNSSNVWSNVRYTKIGQLRLKIVYRYKENDFLFDSRTLLCVAVLKHENMSLCAMQATQINMVLFVYTIDDSITLLFIAVSNRFSRSLFWTIVFDRCLNLFRSITKHWSTALNYFVFEIETFYLLPLLASMSRPQVLFDSFTSNNRQKSRGKNDSFKYDHIRDNLYLCYN